MKNKINLLYIFILLFTVSTKIIELQTPPRYIESLYKVLFWILLMILTKILIKDERKGKKELDKTKIIVIITLIYIIISFLSGLLTNYQNSPYSHTFMNIVKNTIIYILIIPFQEIIREKLAKNNNKYSNLILIALIYIIIDINIHNIDEHFSNNEAIFKMIFENILPNIAQNILCTYLVVMASYKTSSLYRLLLVTYEIMMPIYPNISPGIKSLSQIILAFIIYIYINYFQENIIKRTPKRNTRRISPHRNIIMPIFLLIMVAFISGIMPIKPISIASKSMEPNINKGDIVIVKKPNPRNGELKKGEIIEYQLENKRIVHRIVDINYTQNGENKYLTKGDNNQTNDEKMVTMSQINGIVLFKIPYLGYPSIWLNELLNK